MKKIIILCTSVAFCSQVFASDENFYIKAGGFGSIANKILSSDFIDEMQKL